MPIRRSKRTRSRRTKPWYKRKYNALQLAAKAAKGVWYLKGLVNSEMLHNQSLSSTTIPNSGILIPVNGIAQGDTASGRTGNSVLMRNLLLKCSFEQNASATITTYRMMIILDKQAIADTVPSATDVLESANPMSPLATASAGRFQVLKQWFFTTDDTKSQTRTIEYYRNMRIHARYNGTANTDIQKNGLYILVIADQATNTPTFRYSYKLGYHDN